MKAKITDIAVIHRQRQEIDPKYIAELAASITAVGLLHPPVVRDPYPDEIEECAGRPYVLMVGGCRLAAHIFLGRDDIEVTHRSDLSPHDAELAELEENIKRRDIPWQDRIRAEERIVALKKADGMSVTQVSEEIIGQSGRNTYLNLAVAEAMTADPEIAKATSLNAAKRLIKRKADTAQRLKNVQSQQETALRERIVCADAVEYAKSLPTRSVQMIFTDLPYAIDYFEVARGSENSPGKFDDDPAKCRDFISNLVPELVRIVKPSGWIVLFMCYEWHGWLQELIGDSCGAHTDGLGGCLGHPEDCFGARPEMPPWVWARPGAGSFGHWPELHAANRYEMIVVANGGNATLAKKPVENLLLYEPVAGPRKHAHEKPLALCRELIERCSLVGESVVDFCFGSGAHLAAAASLGRDFRGCDNNPANLDGAIAYVAEHFHGDAAIRAAQGAKAPDQS